MRVQTFQRQIQVGKTLEANVDAVYYPGNPKAVGVSPGESRGSNLLHLRLELAAVLTPVRRPGDCDSRDGARWLSLPLWLGETPQNTV